MKVETAEIGPNDVLVFTASQIMSDEQFKKFRALLKGNLEKAGLADNKFIALDASVNLQILNVRKASEETTRELSPEQFATIRSMIDEQVHMRLERGLPISVRQ